VMHDLRDVTVRGAPVSLDYAKNPRNEPRRDGGPPEAWSTDGDAKDHGAPAVVATTPPPPPEWPPTFANGGAAYVLHSSTGLYFEAASQFYYDTRSQLYFSVRKHQYFRCLDSTFVPFVPPQPPEKPKTDAAGGNGQEASSKLQKVSLSLSLGKACFPQRRTTSGREVLGFLTSPPSRSS